jgi:hypothetical protein
MGAKSQVSEVTTRHATLSYSRRQDARARVGHATLIDAVVCCAAIHSLRTKDMKYSPAARGAYTLVTEEEPPARVNRRQGRSSCPIRVTNRDASVSGFSISPPIHHREDAPSPTVV